MMTISPPNTLCDRCSAPARAEDVELAQFYQFYKVTVLCAVCGEKEEAEEAARIAAQRQRQEDAARQVRLEIIPPEIRRTDLANPRFNSILSEKVSKWRPSSTKWLGIVGPAGECKTRCLGVLAAQLIMAGHRLHWTSAVEFQERSDDMRSDDRQIKGAASEYFRECRSTAILVLDDFGKNTWTPTVERNLFSLIDHRKTHDLPVLWSANTHPRAILASGELSQDRAAPLIGRILEASHIIPTTR